MSQITYYKQLTDADGQTWQWHERACHDNGDVASDRVVDADQQPLLDWLASNEPEVRAYVAPPEVPPYDPEARFARLPLLDRIAAVVAYRLYQYHSEQFCAGVQANVLAVLAKPESDRTEADETALNNGLALNNLRESIIDDVKAKAAAEGWQ